ncbi:MAG: hypothetical protein L3J08_08395, partial [Flavobacteriaceae bacterium]|nr:hypothetical protein [Flavobacteriaceae bacterium]
KYLKGDYVKEVQKILVQRGIKNRNGENYGASIVRNVLNGTNKNHKIKDALLQVYLDRKALDEEFNNLLKIKNREDNGSAY